MAVLNEARQRKEAVRLEARGISKSYHPFDLDTAELRDATTVEQDLKAHFDAIEEAASEAGISSKCWDLLQKARRLVPKMVATITFVQAKIVETLSALDDSERVKEALRDYLIPLLYLKEVSP
jgi:septation ring formation regulator EzrA